MMNMERVAPTWVAIMNKVMTSHSSLLSNKQTNSAHPSASLSAKRRWQLEASLHSAPEQLDWAKPTPTQSKRSTTCKWCKLWRGNLKTELFPPLFGSHSVNFKAIGTSSIIFMPLCEEHLTIVPAAVYFSGLELLRKEKPRKSIFSRQSSTLPRGKCFPKRTTVPKYF